MYKHSGYRPHKCPICNFAAVDKGTITKHLRVHTGDLPFSCKTCGKFSLLENYARLFEMHYSDFASKTRLNFTLVVKFTIFCVLQGSSSHSKADWRDTNEFIWE